MDLETIQYYLHPIRTHNFYLDLLPDWYRRRNWYLIDFSGAFHRHWVEWIHYRRIHQGLRPARTKFHVRSQDTLIQDRFHTLLQEVEQNKLNSSCLRAREHVLMR